MFDVFIDLNDCKICPLYNHFSKMCTFSVESFFVPDICPRKALQTVHDDVKGNLTVRKEI